MTSSPIAPGSRLASRLGFSDRVFIGPAARRVARAIEDGLELVETGLADDVRVADPLADAASRYLYEAGGKRIRPVLTLLAAQLGDGNTTEVIDVAKALEITHLGSLYHDDVMDGADRRRGVPAAHAVWGNNIAILTGDILFSRASQLMSRLGSVPSVSRPTRSSVWCSVRCTRPWDRRTATTRSSSTSRCSPTRRAP